MAVSALLVLATLMLGRWTVFAQKDCPVLVTGPDRQWTPARRLERIPAAPPTHHQFPGRPPGGSELSLSVQSLLSGLEIHLFSSRHPGGFLLHVDATGWRVDRTIVGAVHSTLSSGPPRPEPVTAADQWSSYAVSVSPPETVQLQRLYDNGTRQAWLQLRHPEVPSADLVSARVTPPSSELRRFGRGRAIGPEAAGQWGFWKFDCSRFYYQTAELCHLWPSWPSDVPLRFRTPHRRISPVTSVNVLFSTSSTTELHLLETPERFYLVTLTASELTLGRAERGVPAARRVARACLTPQKATKRFRLLWVSMVTGFISVGVEGASSQPCREDGAEVAPEPAAISTTEEAMTAFNASFGLDDGTANSTQVTEETVSQTEAATTPAPARTALVTWQDGIAYSVASYGLRTPDGQGVWTVGCQPRSDAVADESKTVELPTRGIFTARTTGYPAADSDGSITGAADSCRSQQPFLLATVALAVISALLLLISVLLGAALVSQRRRRAAELADQRRLSLVSTDLFSALPQGGEGEHEYAEVHLYDRVRPMSVLPGESTFKPLRRRKTGVTPPEEGTGEVPVVDGEAAVADDEVVVVDDASEAQGTPETREASVEPLPPPPENV